MVMEDIRTDYFIEEGFWKVLIVDDDNFIHRVVVEMNKELKFDNKPVKFLNAYNYDEAIKILEENSDIALVLLDIFLVEPYMGLKVAKYIREVQENEDTRIVLMTGKGHAGLHEQAVLDYDINGFEHKSELLSKKMNIIIISALRSYRDINRIKFNRESMERMVSSITKLYEKEGINEFLTTSLCHLSSLINRCKDNTNHKDNCLINSFVAVRQNDTNIFKIIDGHGRYKKYIDEKVRTSVTESELIKLNKIYQGGDQELFDNCYVAKYRSTAGNEALIYIENVNQNQYIDRELLDIFHKSISATFETLCLNIEIEETQKEILYTLGEVTEARSEETSSHVKRVSKYSELLAEKYGLPQRDTMLLTHATPIHDIGKVAIPDSILLKPGKLTPEEFNVVKTHTSIGYNLLKNSKREILKAAAIVAHEHHERYDGKGYPRGLKGEEIHIYGRISAIADVFDALGSPRVYKKAWVINDILNYFKEERGKHFDPILVDLLFENLDEFLEIRDKYCDGKEMEQSSGV